jgi:hypothetical protein
VVGGALQCRRVGHSEVEDVRGAGAVCDHCVGEEVLGLRQTICRVVERQHLRVGGAVRRHGTGKEDRHLLRDQRVKSCRSQRVVDIAGDDGIGSGGPGLLEACADRGRDELAVADAHVDAGLPQRLGHRCSRRGQDGYGGADRDVPDRLPAELRYSVERPDGRIVGDRRFVRRHDVASLRHVVG